LIAVAVLFYVSNWMLSKSESEAWQKYLDKKEQKIKLLINFSLDDGIDEAIKEINKKEIKF
jgi:hypothetical protein